MAKKKRARSRRPERLIRLIEITGVKGGVSLSPSGDREGAPDFESGAYLELTGTMDEAIRGVRDVEMRLYSATAPKVGTKPVSWIGLVHGFRPVMRPALFIPNVAFDRLWTMAGTGMLKHAYLVLTQPHYHDAYVLNLSLSTHPEE
jgi:hypothetical protein